MRKLIFIGCIALGVLIGLVSGVNGDWGTRIVMMCIGALVGTAIGGGWVPSRCRNLLRGWTYRTEKVRRRTSWLRITGATGGMHHSRSRQRLPPTGICSIPTNFTDYFRSRSFTTSFAFSIVAPASFPTCLPD